MARSRPKKAITLRLDADLVDAFRALIKDYAGKPYYLSPGSFVTDAITNHLAEMRRRIEGTTSLSRDHHPTRIRR